MRAIKRERRHEEMVKLLAERNHPDAKGSVFGSMRDLLTFAAALGFRERRKRPLDGDTIEIPARIFENRPETLDLMSIIAVLENRDPEKLGPDQDDTITHIFEEYANGGLDIISEWRADRPDDSYGADTLINRLSNLVEANENSTTGFVPKGIQF
jgi:dnd system-associated protein 4